MTNLIYFVSKALSTAHIPNVTDRTDGLLKQDRHVLENVLVIFELWPDLLHAQLFKSRQLSCQADLERLEQSFFTLDDHDHVRPRDVVLRGQMIFKLYAEEPHELFRILEQRLQIFQVNFVLVIVSPGQWRHVSLGKFREK